MNVLGFSGLQHSVPYKQRVYPGLSRVQYRICQGFDAAAALVSPDGILAAAAEERFNRQKTSGAFPVNAIQFCLGRTGLALRDIDYIAHGFNYEPYRDYYYESDEGRAQFDEVYSRTALLQDIQTHLGRDVAWDERFVQVPHHLAHAASTFYPSGLDEALIVVADGMGEHQGLTVAVGQGDAIDVVTEIPSIHSLGILYSVFTLYLGFDFNMDEYKVMGLAPYGDAKTYFDQVMGFVNLEDDGTHTIPLLFKNAPGLEKETYEGSLRVLESLFGPRRAPESAITQHHQDLAAALQAVLQTTMQHLLRAFRKQTKMRNLCLAGGVALNCTNNGVIKRSRMFKQMFVQPAAGDDGSALGAALYVYHRHTSGQAKSAMSLPLWGPSYSQEEILAAVEADPSCRATTYASFDELAPIVAQRLANGDILGLFQGRMEFGPRALGARSIIADPRGAQMRDKINALVKKREEFRPFAPAVAAEDAHRFFEVQPGDESVFAYMLCVTHVQKEYQAELPAITHVDGSARMQTVNQQDNPHFWALLKAFETLSGMPILLNTSFNVRGQPMVCSPTEAVETFLDASLDALVIGNMIVERTTPAAR